MSICIDASLVIPMVTAHPLSRKVDDLYQGWMADNTSLLAPTLRWYEVTNGIYRYYRAGTMTAAQCRIALDCARDLGIVLLAPPELHGEALDLAGEFGLPATDDAHYAALARRQRADFYTADRRLAGRLADRVDWCHYVQLD